MKMFGNIMNKLNDALDDTEQIDDQFYAKVMDELDQGFRDKAAYAKSIAQSEGDEAKATSLYIKIRAKALQRENKQQDEMVQIEKDKQQQDKQQLVSDILLNHKNGYFNNLFKDEIRQRGFTGSWFFKDILIKNGITYDTIIDTDNMDFLIVDKKGKIIHRFHFEV